MWPGDRPSCSQKEARSRRIAMALLGGHRAALSPWGHQGMEAGHSRVSAENDTEKVQVTLERWKGHIECQC